MLFKLGTIVHTPGFEGVCGDDLRQNCNTLLKRHSEGDWGDLCAEDKEMNEQAIVPGNAQRVLSKYDLGGESVYVITEWDRSVTTLLLPSEY